MIQGTAVPKWTSELLPKFFCDRPALTEALWAAFISLQHSTYMVFGLVAADAMGDGVTTLGAFIAWLPAHWFVPVVGYVIGGYTARQRAKEAGDKAIAAETAPIITPP